MTQTERRIYLINTLLAENGGYKSCNPEILSVTEQKKLLRSLMNIRMPAPLDDEFVVIQDEYLKQEINEKGITDINSLTPVEYLFGFSSSQRVLPINAKTGL